MNFRQFTWTKLISILFSSVKLISSGIILNRLQTLDDQQLHNNQQVMAIVMETTSTEANEESAVYDKFQTTKSDAEILLKRSDSYMDVSFSVIPFKKNEFNFLWFFQMEDQDGNIVHLPPEEKRALLMALAMHEKGRAALKREDFNEALILLLDADQEYKTCNSRMLESVDNYALLNLDIVWSYLMLKVSRHCCEHFSIINLFNLVEFVVECDAIAGCSKTLENLRAKFQKKLWRKSRSSGIAEGNCGQ